MLTLQHARVEVAGLSMEALADRMRRSVSTISRWEAHANPSVGVVVAWLHACGIRDKPMQQAYLHDIAVAAAKRAKPVRPVEAA